MEPRRTGQLERHRELGPRPEPGPPPIPEALPEPGRRRVRVQPRRTRGLRKRVAVFARSKPGRWTLIALACITVLLIGLIGQGFLSSSPSAGGPDAAATGGLSLGPSDAGLHPTKTAKASASPSAKASKVRGTDPLQIMRSRFPDNPLNHLRGGGVHTVTVKVDSLTRIPFVGYLVPTGLGSAYDTIKPKGRHWSMTEKALGKGYLAAIFIQSGKTGVPVTCTVVVDGHVTNTETTAGSYGRSVCLG